MQRLQLLTLMDETTEGFYHSDEVLIISLHMTHGSWGPSRPQSSYVDELGGREVVAKMVKRKEHLRGLL